MLCYWYCEFSQSVSQAVGQSLSWLSTFVSQSWIGEEEGKGHCTTSNISFPLTNSLKNLKNSDELHSRFQQVSISSFENYTNLRTWSRTYPHLRQVSRFSSSHSGQVSFLRRFRIARLKNRFVSVYVCVGVWVSSFLRQRFFHTSQVPQLTRFIVIVVVIVEFRFSGQDCKFWARYCTLFMVSHSRFFLLIVCLCVWYSSPSNTLQVFRKFVSTIVCVWRRIVKGLSSIQSITSIIIFILQSYPIPNPRQIV